MRPLASRSFRAMGTEVRLFLDAPDAMEALVTAERDVAALERRFSRFIAGSELSRVNAADGSWVRISPDMAEVLDAAAAMHRATGGLFDPLVLAALERAGYDRTFAEVGDAGPRAAARRERPTFAAVERHGDAVRLPRGARMDLGGIVKGWAADRIADDLALVGPALVDLGGDIAVRGTPYGDDAWSIGVEDPDGGPHLAELRVQFGAVATSSTRKRRWTRDGEAMHHLIDPRSGEPGESDLVAVVALHPSALVADVWAKCVLLERPERRDALVASCDGLDAILIPATGAAVGTPGALARCVSDVAA